MFTIEEFKKRLMLSSHPDCLHVGVDSKDESQLYIILNGGIANINCDPIELYPAGIKHCALEMITQEQLYLKPNEKPLRIGENHRIYCYTLQLDKNLTQAEPSERSMYFSSLFIRWQRTHQLSDKHAQKRLGLTAKEFILFKEDELVITQSLINILAEVTGVSAQFWKNRWHQKINRQQT